MFCSVGWGGKIPAVFWKQLVSCASEGPKARGLGVSPCIHHAAVFAMVKVLSLSRFPHWLVTNSPLLAIAALGLFLSVVLGQEKERIGSHVAALKFFLSSFSIPEKFLKYVFYGPSSPSIHRHPVETTWPELSLRNPPALLLYHTPFFAWCQGLDGNTGGPSDLSQDVSCVVTLNGCPYVLQQEGLVLSGGARSCANNPVRCSAAHPAKSKGILGWVKRGK